MRATANCWPTIWKRPSFSRRCCIASPSANSEGPRVADENLERDVHFRGLAPEQRELLMIQAAKRYYGLDMTIGDLAKEMGLTRWQARRLLDEARASGV